MPESSSYGPLVDVLDELIATVYPYKLEDYQLEALKEIRARLVAEQRQK